MEENKQIEENKQKPSKAVLIISILSSVAMILAVLERGMRGMRAGYEQLAPYVIAGIVLALVAIAMKRSKSSYTAVVINVLGILALMFL